MTVTYKPVYQHCVNTCFGAGVDTCVNTTSGPGVDTPSPSQVCQRCVNVDTTALATLPLPPGKEGSEGAPRQLKSASSPVTARYRPCRSAAAPVAPLPLPACPALPVGRRPVKTKSIQHTQQAVVYVCKAGGQVNGRTNGQADRQMRRQA